MRKIIGLVLESGHPDRPRLDEDIRGIQAVFEQNGDQLWNAELASRTVTAVVLRERRSTGLMGHEDVPVTHYVASAILRFTFQETLDCAWEARTGFGPR